LNDLYRSGPHDCDTVEEEDEVLRCSECGVEIESGTMCEIDRIDVEDLDDLLRAG